MPGSLLIFEQMGLANPRPDILIPALPQPSASVIDVPARPGRGFALDESALTRVRRDR